jgi:hypothetical protein
MGSALTAFWVSLLDSLILGSLTLGAGLTGQCMRNRRRRLG